MLSWTREHLTRRGVESPRLVSELLLAHALGCDRLRLMLRLDEVPRDDQRAVFRAHVQQAAQHHPVAYLLGYREFFALDMRVTQDVLIPRPETEVLVERAIHWLRECDASQPRVADIGTGSGCVAIAIAKHVPEVQLVATDVSSAALTVARENVAAHGVDGQITLLEGDLLAPLADQAAFDLIVSNPPYVAENSRDTLPSNVREYEPHLALFSGADGLAHLGRLLEDAPVRLTPDGAMMLEFAFDQASAVEGLVSDADWRHVATIRDPGGHPRVLHVERARTTAQETDQASVA